MGKGPDLAGYGRRKEVRGQVASTPTSVEAAGFLDEPSGCSLLSTDGRRRTSRGLSANFSTQLWEVKRENRKSGDRGLPRLVP